MGTDLNNEKLAAPALETPEYVARQIAGGAVVVAGHHPVLGAVYWSFTDEADVNAPDHYGLTLHLDDAHRFRPGHVRFARFHSAIIECNSQRYDCDEAGGLYEVEVGSDDFHLVAGDTDVGADAVLAWFKRAVWVECPAPQAVRYIADFNGYVGYRPVWTERLSQALRFSQEEIEDDGDLDVALARTVAELVDVADAENDVSLLGRLERSPVNHPLEADVAWTRVRLRLGGYAELQDWTRMAFAHAARAGREEVITGEIGGECGEIACASGHLSAYPELLEAFRVGVAVQQAGR